MKTKVLRYLLAGAVAAIGAPPLLWFGVLTSGDSRALGKEVLEFYDLIQPPEGQIAATISATLSVGPGRGVPGIFEGQPLEIRYRAPDHLEIGAVMDEKPCRVGRNGDEIWFHAPSEEFALLGRNEVPRFASDAGSAREIRLLPFRFPVSRDRMRLLPAIMQVEGSSPWKFRFKSWAVNQWGLPEGVITIDFPGDSPIPRLVSFDGEALGFQAQLRDRSVATGDAAGQFELPEIANESVEAVALEHLARFLEVAFAGLDRSIPALTDNDRGRSLVARHGNGRLERVDGTRVLFLKGTPEEMGEQHGVLLRDEVRSLVDNILYGVGVGSSLGKGRWFFGEIEEAQARLEPHIPDRHLREMDALAFAADLHPQEIRLANFFPELFHCSGFALHGAATAGGRIYHGRVLDYLRGLGLEENAVVMVVEPDEGNAWVNVGYAAFVGSVTAMNEKQIAIGEMGGRGEGRWDGKPMSQLMREVMEHADTIDEAVELMRRGPRTCEYYYVISDGNSGRAVGIKATPEVFETVWSGESHPQLSRPVEDTVILSADERYEALVDRVEANWGEFDAVSARALMDPPVCMDSNIQSVLFAPDTLDFWVANADSESVASETRYTKYNLRELLDRKDTSSEPLAGR